MHYNHTLEQRYCMDEFDMILLHHHSIPLHPIQFDSIEFSSHRFYRCTRMCRNRIDPHTVWCQVCRKLYHSLVSLWHKPEYDLRYYFPPKKLNELYSLIYDVEKSDDHSCIVIVNVIRHSFLKERDGNADLYSIYPSFFFRKKAFVFLTRLKHFTFHREWMWRSEICWLPSILRTALEHNELSGKIYTVFWKKVNYVNNQKKICWEIKTHHFIEYM